MKKDFTTIKSSPLISIETAKKKIPSLKVGETLYIIADTVMIGKLVTTITYEDESLDIDLQHQIILEDPFIPRSKRAIPTIHCDFISLRKEKDCFILEPIINLQNKDMPHIWAKRKSKNNSSTIIKKRTQYVFTPKQIIDLFQNIDEFRELVLSRHYVYADNMIVPANPVLFDKRRKGVHIKKSYYNDKDLICAHCDTTRYYHSFGLARQIEMIKKRQITIVHSKTYGTRKYGEEAFVEFLALYENSGTPNETFGQALTRFMKEQKFNKDTLAEAICVDPRTIERYMKDKTNPSLKNVIAICIAMHLFQANSEYLITKAGFSIHNPQYKKYLGLITFLAPEDITECNRILTENGLEPLTDQMPEDYYS